MNALELALRRQSEEERSSPIPAAPACAEKARESNRQECNRLSARALLTWAKIHGQFDHPVAQKLYAALVADSDDIFDLTTRFWFEIPQSAAEHVCYGNRASWGGKFLV